MARKTASKAARKGGSKSKKTVASKKGSSKSRIPPVTFKRAYEDDPAFKQYGSNALSYFALSLKLRIEDLGEFAAESNVDGGNDKKLDICHIDINEGLAVLVQSYLSPRWDKTEAPVNKASDLNTAMAWLLTADERTIPAQLKSKAIELRDGIKSGEIKRIELLFIHNCLESPNAESELKVVADATKAKVSALLGGAANDITIAHRELGLRGIEDLYQSRDSDILVDAWLNIPADKGNFIEAEGAGWRGVLTTVPGDWVQGLYAKHGDRLFSANYRDYLGSTKHQGNINNAITETAKTESDNFWAYNNGVTALTHQIDFNKPKRGKRRVRGISIINGAQTTGSLSEAAQDATKLTRLMLRIIECSSKDLVHKIIRYNNTQNAITPADTRSKDVVQRRLKEDFKSNYNITYAHRRSLDKVPTDAITCAAMGGPLCAFHGEPQTAYRNAKNIFNDDAVYNRVFPLNITAEHVFLIRALSVAIDTVKAELKLKTIDGTATDTDSKQYDMLKFSASKHFIFYLIGQLADQIMGRPVADRYDWKCKKDVIAPNNVSLTRAWIAVLKAILPLAAMVVENLESEESDPFYEVQRSMELSKQVANGTKTLIAAYSVLTPQFEELRRRTEI